MRQGGDVISRRNLPGLRCEGGLPGREVTSARPRATRGRTRNLTDDNCPFQLLVIACITAVASSPNTAASRIADR